jgi:uncharacterized Ntn-hydrolase superfamily protein
MQSAAMLVVDRARTGRPWADRVVDIRVEDAAHPLVELRRLLGIRRAYLARNLAEAAFARGEIEEGNRQYQLAEQLIGDNPEMRFWHAVALVNARRIEQALPIFKDVFAKDRRWLELAERLVPLGRLLADPSLITMIREVAR